MKQRAIGICTGASTIKVVELLACGGTYVISQSRVIPHESDPHLAFSKVIAALDIKETDYCMLTGRAFRMMVNAPSITEPEAVEYALEYVKEHGMAGADIGAVASLGSENFVVYKLDSGGHITGVETGNKCASGTGAFFLQQIGRINVSAEEAIALARNSEAYKVTGRCSVFCKSDCTHALNKGVPIGRVASGLCTMMAEKISDLLQTSGVRPVCAVGGVTKNAFIMDLLRKRVANLIIPQEADVFEALGAAHYALRRKTLWGRAREPESLFHTGKCSFEKLPPIRTGEALCTFHPASEARACEGEECVVGLDVGSTTTKAVLMRLRDSAVITSVYLRTNGNPVRAARECYAALDRTIGGGAAHIVGLGTTGSGRQIAGIHAETDAVINEIIAHATGAAYFDPAVDTIFEIGGQDAKYTSLVGGVPSDYAMNEACSAGTGSFLEEAARESLATDYRNIEPVALEGRQPLNFNDQCTAFISSDIKTAVHEGVEKSDIVAGLVYSICMNYVNRVKGPRPLGKKIFMQGGVCYNRAVPLAMAALLNREIVVPPDPGLTGAFGVALEVKDRIGRGRMAKKVYNLTSLASSDIEHAPSFFCKDERGDCNRGCEIAVLLLKGKRYLFGGACNKYYNLIRHGAARPDAADYVKIRQRLVFHRFAAKAEPGKLSHAPTVGINRSYLTNQLYPLYSHFFSCLGANVVLADAVNPDGMKFKRTSICFPGEIAHGSFYHLLKKKPDYIFLPKVLELHIDTNMPARREHQCTCLLLQSEPYYLKSAFKSQLSSTQLLSPTLDFAKGYGPQEEQFIEMGMQLGASRKAGSLAFKAAVEQQLAFERTLTFTGRQAMAALSENESQIAIVLFGRSYNAFAPEANLGIPSKFVSRGVPVIPWDMLPFEHEATTQDMNWAIGQGLLKAARYARKQPRLYGVCITNFSCGPDSFLVNYLREIMEPKPFLTLELDGHTADAGITTRIEAFLEIIARRATAVHHSAPSPASPFMPASVKIGKALTFVDSKKNEVPILDKRVRVVIPSLGRLTAELFGAVWAGGGIQADVLPPCDYADLKKSRPHCSCKECLPLLLVTGGFLNYLAQRRKNADEKTVLFMPSSPGNCRFTQYQVVLRKLIEKHRIENVALLTLSNETGYAGLPPRLLINTIKGVVIADCMEDIRNALTVLAIDRESALRSFEREWCRIKTFFLSGQQKSIAPLLRDTARTFSLIPLRYPLARAKIAGLHGEIFVRRDDFSCQDLIGRLAKRDIVVKRAHVFEWLDYCDYNVKTGVFEPQFTLPQKGLFLAKSVIVHHMEKQVKAIFSQSGLYDYNLVGMKEIISLGSRFFDPRFTGEAIIVVGSFFKEIIRKIHGMISIGPFACMATRVTEAVLSAEACMGTLENLEKESARLKPRATVDCKDLPFLSIESDGNPFPQIIEARIDAFCLQVERLHEKIQAAKGTP